MQTETLSIENSSESLPSIEDLRAVEHWGFDVEDTVTRHDPLKHMMKLWATISAYYQKEVAKSGDETAYENYNSFSLTELQQKVRRLADNFPFPESSSDYVKTHSALPLGDPADLFMFAIEGWTRAIDDDRHRDQIITEMFGLTKNQFWYYYRIVSQQAASNPVEYARANQQTPTEGAIPFLNFLASSGKNIHFITNSPHKRVMPYLTNLQVNGYNGPIELISAVDLNHPKPDPYVINALIAKHNIVHINSQRRGIVYVGNAISDWNTVESAGGLPVIINPFGHDFSKLGATPRYEARTLANLHQALLS